MQPDCLERRGSLILTKAHKHFKYLRQGSNTTKEKPWIEVLDLNLAYVAVFSFKIFISSTPHLVLLFSTGQRGKKYFDLRIPKYSIRIERCAFKCYFSRCKNVQAVELTLVSISTQCEEWFLSNYEPPQVWKTSKFEGEPQWGFTWTDTAPIWHTHYYNIYICWGNILRSKSYIVGF